MNLVDDEMAHWAEKHDKMPESERRGKQAVWDSMVVTEAYQQILTETNQVDKGRIIVASTKPNGKRLNVSPVPALSTCLSNSAF